MEVLFMIIAKTKPEIESLFEHTNELLSRYKVLKSAYHRNIPNEKVWDLLYKAALYHDLGKVNNEFQGRLHKLIQSDTKIPPSNFGYIPHNYLSPFFLPLDKWHFTKDEEKALIQAISYHHERAQIPEPLLLKKNFEEELIPNYPKILKEMKDLIKLPDADQKTFPVMNSFNRRITEAKDKEQTYYLYILVKGLLHRLDHAASAHVDIEIDTQIDIGEITNNYINKNFNIDNYTKHARRPLQDFTYKNQDKNLIIVAQTGMGKTEASLLWAGKDKTFFTLPIRVSLNALFNRVYNDMNYKHVGLLHGSSASHLDDNGIENWEQIYDQSKHLANKLIFTTVDQILKFPFKFKGYEKFLATMAYSKVIIDEIQAYSPWIVAVILRAIEMIHKAGGKFMIMTATMPQIYLDELKKRNIIDENCAQEEFIDETYIRHKISLEKKALHTDIEKISTLSKKHKVLVIVNTVNKAIELYNELSNENSYLLHSRFIQRDRSLLEQRIQEFAKSEQNGIWITTQLVEASIDIDFDYLFTELSPIDSLLQRFGRCYRNRELEHSKPNIHIYTKKYSGEDSVYNKDILGLTEHYLEEFHNKEINERVKIDLVKKIYSKEELQDTEFYIDFKNAIKRLQRLDDYQCTNEEAQRILRGDKCQSITVIPRTIYDEIYDLFESLESEQDSLERIRLRREIEKYTVSIRRSKDIEHSIDSIDFYQIGKDGRKYPVLSHIKVLDAHYNFDIEELHGIGLDINNTNTFL